MSQRLVIDIEANTGKAAKGFKDVETGIAEMDRTVQRSGYNFQAYQKQVEKITDSYDKWIKRSLVVAGAAFAGMTYKAAEFSNTMHVVSTATDESTAGMKRMEDQVLNLLDGFSNATDNANSLYDAIGSGLSAERAMEAVGEATKAAIVNVTDMKNTVDSAVVANNVYGESIGSMTNFYDKFTKTVILAKLRGQEFANTFSQIAGGAHLAGISLDELFSYYVSVTRGGLNAAQATVGLQNAIMQIASPSKEATATAKKLGFEFNIAALQAKGFANFFKEIAEKAGNNNQAIIDLFGSIRAFRAIAVLTTETGMKNFNLGLQEMIDSAGATEEAFKKMTEGNLQYQASALYQGIMNAAIKESLPMLESMAKYIAENREEIVQAFKGIIEFAKTVGSVMIGILKIFVELRNPIQVIATYMLTVWAIGKMITFYETMKLIVIGTREFLAVLQATRLQTAALQVEYNNASQSIVSSSGFMSATVSKSFMSIIPVASTVAIAAAMAFRQAMQLVIDDLDAQMARIIDRANQQKTLTDKFRLIMAEGTEAEKAQIKAIIEQERAIRKAAEAGGAEILKHYQEQNRTYSQIAYERNKKEIDAQAARIKNELEAESKIVEIKKSGTAQQKALLDQMIAKYGNTRQAVIQVMGEYQKAEQIQSEASKKAIELNEKQVEAIGKLRDAIGLISSESLEKEKIQVKALESVWKDSHARVTGNIETVNAYLNELSKTREVLEKAGETVPVWMKETAIELLSLKAALETFNFEVELMKENEIDAAIAGKEYDTTLAGTVITQGKFSESLAETTEFIIAMQEEMKAGRMSIDDYLSGMMNIIESLEKIGAISGDISGALNDVFREVGNVFNLASQGQKLWDSFNKIQAEIEKVKRDTPDAVDKIKELTNLAENAKPRFFDSLVSSISLAAVAFSAFQSIVSFIVKLFKEDFHDAATEALGGLPGATGEMVDNLAEAAEKVGDINRALAEMYAQMLKNANLINGAQFSRWAGTFAQLIDHYIASINSAYQVFLFNFGSNTGETGAMGTELQAQLENLNAGFQQIITEAQRLGTEGSAAMLEIIQKARDLEAEGYRIQAVWDYVTGKVTGAASGLELFLSSFGDTAAIQKEMADVMRGYRQQIDDKQKEIDRVQKEIDENKSDIEKSKAAAGFQNSIDTKQAEIDALEEQYSKAKGKHRKEFISSEIEAKEKELAALEKELRKTGMTGTEEERAALEAKRLALQEEMNTYKTDMQLLISESNNMLTYYMNQLEVTREDIVNNWDFIQGSVMATFNAFRAQGIPLLEIVTGRMKSQFDKIAELAKANGLEVTGGLQRLLDISNFGKNFEALSKQITGVYQMFTGLGDAGFFKGEQGAKDFEIFSGKILSQYDQIIAKTGNAQLAYDLLGPSLQKLEQYALSYNIKLDPATQALIDNAKAAGAFSEVAQTDAQIMMEGSVGVTKALLLLVETMGGTVPDAMKKMVEEMKKKAGMVTEETVTAAADVQENINDAVTTGSGDAAASVIAETEKMKIGFQSVTMEIENIGNTMSITMVAAAETMKSGVQTALDQMSIGFSSVKTQIDGVIASIETALSLTSGSLPGSTQVVPGYAVGTRGYVKNRTAVVGERGPELLHFSGTGDYMNITPIKGPGGERGGRVVHVPVIEERRVTVSHNIKIDGRAKTDVNDQVLRQLITDIKNDRAGIRNYLIQLFRTV